MSSRTSVVRTIVVVAIGRDGTSTHCDHTDQGSRSETAGQAGEEEVKQLLLLIDTEKRGKITKQEWMKFMEAEFVPSFKSDLCA